MTLSITKVDLYALIFTVNTVTMPPSKSNAWKYFKRSADDKTVKCTLCSSEMTYTGGTTNMLNHLRLKHPSEQKPSNNDKQFSMDSFVNSPKKLSSSQSEKITQAIADMIIKDYIPLSIVESESFVNLMQIVAPDYKVPSRNTVKSQKKGDTHLLLKDHEWEVISDLVNVLKDFTKVTAYMSTETNVSCSQIYPIVCGLLNTSLRIENSDSQLVRKVKETIADELNRRYQPTSSEIFGSTAAFSTILDPRYKRLPFFNSEQRKTAKDALESRLDEIPLKLPSRNQSEIDSAPSKRQRTESSLDFLMCYSPEKQEQDDELDRYLACKCDSKPLVWWKEHEKDFPRIALIAKKVLAVPATSVPSERIFSAAGLLVNKLRNRLSSALVDKIIFLNKNKVSVFDGYDE